MCLLAKTHKTDPLIQTVSLVITMQLENPNIKPLGKLRDPPDTTQVWK